MRQVDLPEVTYVVAGALADIEASLWKQLLDPRRAERDRARATVAGRIAGRMNRWEILSTAPATTDSSFEQPLLRMMGEPVRSGAPPIASPQCENGPT
jgi:hypothetical protein